MERNDTALEGIKMMIADGIVTQEAAEKYFPELKESEDERTQLTEFLKDLIDKGASDRYGRKDFERWKFWLERQGEKKPDEKVESKFKIGDWVIDEIGIVYQIANVIKYVTYHTYGYDVVGGGYFNDNTEGVRLWTIQDAKAGDVLCWDDSKCIALFKNIYDNDSFESYGFVGHRTGIFQPSESYHDIKDAHPATKVQRERFFAKMREAGYEWDAETLELKKI